MKLARRKIKKPKKKKTESRVQKRPIMKKVETVEFVFLTICPLSDRRLQSKVKIDTQKW